MTQSSWSPVINSERAVLVAIYEHKVIVTENLKAMLRHRQGIRTPHAHRERRLCSVSAQILLEDLSGS